MLKKENNKLKGKIKKLHLRTKWLNLIFVKVFQSFYLIFNVAVKNPNIDYGGCMTKEKTN